MNEGIQDSLPEWMRAALEALAVALRSALGPLDGFLASLPLETGRWSAAALFLITAACVFGLKRDFVYQGAPDRSWWRDLRYWALLALLPYAVVYLFFFRGVP